MPSEGQAFAPVPFANKRSALFSLKPTSKHSLSKNRPQHSRGPREVNSESTKMFSNVIVRQLSLLLIISWSLKETSACIKKKYYRDMDGDGFGDPNSWAKRCRPPSHYAWTLENKALDCNDQDPLTHPGGTEVCDGVDNNCDGKIDEGSTTLYYEDRDGDGYGDSNRTKQVLCGEAPPQGFVTTGGDCSPTDAKVHPKALEIEDGIDNDCNGKTDDLQLHPSSDKEMRD